MKVGGKPTMAIRQETVSLGGSPALEGFLARPEEEGSYPALVVIFEVFGLNHQIQEVARRLAAEGYVALAPDFFRHPPTGYQEFEEARRVASSLSDTQAMADVGRAFDYLEQQPFVCKGRPGVMGFCMGGRLAFLAACRFPDRVAACVDFYGARKSGGSVHPGQTMVALDEAPALTCPVLIFYGEKDAFIPPEERDKVRSRLESLSKTFEMHVYSGADHGFFCEERASFHPVAAADAWEKVMAFLHTCLETAGDNRAGAGPVA
jgi:carboxymethylenebutenolidase